MAIRKQIGGRILGDDRQDGAEQPAVGEQRRGDVDRVAGRGETGQHRREFALRRRGEMRERHAALSGEIGGHDATRAGIADGDETPAGGAPALQIHLRRAHQARDIGRAPDAVLAQEGIDDTVLAGERAGMRGGGALARRACARSSPRRPARRAGARARPPRRASPGRGWLRDRAAAA